MKPMLASPAPAIEQLRYPLLASMKIDGIRCLIVEGQAVTRAFKPIPNPHIREMLAGLPPLDGELEVIDDDYPMGRTPFTTTSSQVMRGYGKPNFRYIVFDCLRDTDLPYGYRYEEMLQTVNALQFDHVVHLNHLTIKDPLELEILEAKAVRNGYEGLITRCPAAFYKYGRSTKREQGMLKIKRIADSEGRIIGFEERMHNANEAQQDAFGRTKRSSHKENMVPMGMLGALVLDTKWGELRVGTGFNDQQRREYWEVRNALIGRLVTFRHSPAVKDKPRFPVFKAFRDEQDIS